MRKIQFKTLAEGLTFLAEHGGSTGESVTGWQIPCKDYNPPSGAFHDAAEFVKLADGSYFGVEAYTNGPLSDVTPDEDFGVNILGFVE